MVEERANLDYAAEDDDTSDDTSDGTSEGTSEGTSDGDGAMGTDAVTAAEVRDDAGATSAGETNEEGKTYGAP